MFLRACVIESFGMSSTAPVTPVLDPASTLAHDLRQPLSAIETIAYYLELTLPPDQDQARRYARQLQDLVAESTAILARASR